MNIQHPENYRKRSTLANSEAMKKMNILLEKANILLKKTNIFIARQISENIRFIVDRTDVFNSNTLIVHDTVIPYGTENKLFFIIR